MQTLTSLILHGMRGADLTHKVPALRRRGLPGETTVSVVHSINRKSLISNIQGVSFEASSHARATFQSSQVSRPSHSFWNLSDAERMGSWKRTNARVKWVRCDRDYKRRHCLFAWCS